MRRRERRLVGPIAPGDRGQHGGERGEAEPGLADAPADQCRHQRARGGDAEPDPGEDRAAGDRAAFGRRCASTVGAASAIAAPPVIPLMKRQTKYQAKPSGKAQARRLATVSAIAPRSVVAAPMAWPTRRAVSAPARYPARFAAPRYTAAEGRTTGRDQRRDQRGIAEPGDADGDEIGRQRRDRRAEGVQWLVLLPIPPVGSE